MPAMSFIVPTRNRVEYLKKTIDSIRNQSNKNFEIIVSDNHSTDGTAEWLSQQSDLHAIRPDRPVPMFEHWNFAVSHSRTKYFVLVSDDDLVGCHTSREVEKITAATPDVGMIVFDHLTIDQNELCLARLRNRLQGLVNPRRVFSEFRYGVATKVCAVVMNVEVFKQVGRFPEVYRLTAADSECFQKIAILFPVYFSHAEQTAASYRVWKGSATTATATSDAWDTEIGLWAKRIVQFAQENGRSRLVRKVEATLVFENRYVALLQEMAAGTQMEIGRRVQSIKSLGPVRIGLAFKRFIATYPKVLRVALAAKATFRSWFG